MRKFLYLLILLLTVLIQIAWAPFFNWRGFVLPFVLLILLLGTFFFKVTEIFVFSFAVGIFFNLIDRGLVGSRSISLVLALTATHIVRNSFLKQKWIGFLIASILAIFVYEVALWLISYI